MDKQPCLSEFKHCSPLLWGTYWNIHKHNKKITWLGVYEEAWSARKQVENVQRTFIITNTFFLFVNCIPFSQSTSMNSHTTKSCTSTELITLWLEPQLTTVETKGLSYVHNVKLLPIAICMLMHSWKSTERSIKTKKTKKQF